MRVKTKVPAHHDIYDERFDPKFAPEAFDKHGDPILSVLELILCKGERVRDAVLLTGMTGEGGDRQWPFSQS